MKKITFAAAAFCVILLVACSGNAGGKAQEMVDSLKIYMDSCAANSGKKSAGEYAEKCIEMRKAANAYLEEIKEDQKAVEEFNKVFEPVWEECKQNTLVPKNYDFEGWSPEELDKLGITLSEEDEDEE